MPETIEDKTEIDTESPANNIFKVPIFLYSWMECSEGGLIQGEQKSTALAEGSTPEEARDSLKSCLGYMPNWLKLPMDKRRRISAFNLRPGQIEPVPFCRRRYRNKRGEYTCGKALHAIPDHLDRADSGFNDNGEFGMCALTGSYDPLDISDCPYKK